MIQPLPSSISPVVSVVIPTYKHQSYVLQTLDSVFAQTFRDFEVIVVNDGSPDNTAAVLAPLVAENRIRYVEQPNSGQAAARNRGIALARGEFLALLDDDDLWPSDKLAWQVQALCANPNVALVYGKIACVNDQGETIAPRDHAADSPSSSSCAPSGNVYDALVHRNFIISPGQCLIRRAALTPAPGGGCFDRALWGCDDWDLWLRLAETAPFLFVDQVALRYRLHSANASHDVLKMHRNFFALYRKHIKRNGAHADRRAMLQASRRQLRGESSAHMFHLAHLDATHGNARTALAKLFWAVRLQLRYLLDWRFARVLAAAIFPHPQRRQREAV